jgi:hypothetical protein
LAVVNVSQVAVEAVGLVKRFGAAHVWRAFALIGALLALTIPAAIICYRRDTAR